MLVDFFKLAIKWFFIHKKSNLTSGPVYNVDSKCVLFVFCYLLYSTGHLSYCRAIYLSCYKYIAHVLYTCNWDLSFSYALPLLRITYVFNRKRSWLKVVHKFCIQVCLSMKLLSGRNQLKLMWLDFSHFLMDLRIEDLPFYDSYLTHVINRI